MSHKTKPKKTVLTRRDFQRHAPKVEGSPELHEHPQTQPDAPIRPLPTVPIPPAPTAKPFALAAVEAHNRENIERLESLVSALSAVRDRLCGIKIAGTPVDWGPISGSSDNLKQQAARVAAAISEIESLANELGKL